jgi:dipeptidase E
MKLFLSSYYLGSRPDRLKALLGPKKHAAIILNAGDAFGDSQRAQYLRTNASELSRLGLTSEELDLRKYFQNPAKLERDLTRFGLLWVTGGNTFILRRAMRESGLDEILPRALEDTDLVYGGYSAGACVLCPSLEGIELADEPHDVPKGYPKEILWDGLGLVSFYVVPHFRSGHAESAAESEGVIAYYKKRSMPYHALTDDQAVVVEGRKVEVVG